MVHINVTAKWIPDHDFHTLLRIYPDGATKARSWGQGVIVITGWNANLPMHDDRVIEVIQLLTDVGLLEGEHLRWKSKNRGISISLHRKYTRRDLESAELLAFDGTRHMESYARTARDQFPKFPVFKLRKCTADVVFSDWPRWIIPDRVRRIIEPAGLRHVIFAPVAPVPGGDRFGDEDILDWSKVGDPWWEITSDFTMPPLSPSVELVAQDGSPFIGYENQLLGVREGMYRTPELHYLRRDVERIGPFDLACTHEHFKKPPRSQRLIASQRFYQCFQEYNLKARWTPVRIDE